MLKQHLNHPGGIPVTNLQSISRKCYLFEVALLWELTEETITLPLSCLQGGLLAHSAQRHREYQGAVTPQTCTLEPSTPALNPAA